jgi:hypothetical protein
VLDAGDPASRLFGKTAADVRAGRVPGAQELARIEERIRAEYQRKLSEAFIESDLEAAAETSPVEDKETYRRRVTDFLKRIVEVVPEIARDGAADTALRDVGLVIGYAADNQLHSEQILVNG